jgi:hypothetical protein
MNQDPQNPTPFEKRTKEVLDESMAKLDGRTLSRLTQARHAALAQKRHPARAWWLTWLPAGAATAAAVLAVVVWTGSGIDPNTSLAANGSGSAFEDIDLLADGDAPDFVGEADEMEFYEWAAGEIES